MPKAYSDLVKEAESAVKSVKDPELRRAAFEKILDDLLMGSANGGGRTPKAIRFGRRSTKKQTSHGSGGPRAYVCEIKEDGFFKKPKTISEVKAELANRGHHIPLTSLSGPLQKLCQDKELRRQKTGDKKKTFVYSNW